MRSRLRCTTSGGGENSTGTMGIFAPALTLSCPHREERLFCNLPKASVLALSAITHSAVYPKGANLFVEGQPARGIFILCSGRMALSTSSADGKTLILRIAESGEVPSVPTSLRPF